MGFGKGDAPMGRLFGGRDLVRGMQQRLGGNAPAVEAHATESVVALDQNDPSAQVRRIEGGGIATRACA